MTQMQKLGKTATRIERNDEIRSLRIIYHSTCVVEFTKDWVKLDSGGWKTYTTKTRMNQASNQFDLKFSVYQHKKEWFVDLGNGVSIPFEDGVTLTRTNPIGAIKPSI